jgi:hypothetical protein
MQNREQLWKQSWQTISFRDTGLTKKDRGQGSSLSLIISFRIKVAALITH